MKKLFEIPDSENLIEIKSPNLSIDSVPELELIVNEGNNNFSLLCNSRKLKTQERKNISGVLVLFELGLNKNYILIIDNLAQIDSLSLEKLAINYWRCQGIKVGSLYSFKEENSKGITNLNYDSDGLIEINNKKAIIKPLSIYKYNPNKIANTLMKHLPDLFGVEEIILKKSPLQNYKHKITVTYNA